MARLSKQVLRWPLMLHQYNQGRTEPLVWVSVSFVQITSLWHAHRHALGRCARMVQGVLNTCIFAHCWRIWAVEWATSGSRLRFSWTFLAWNSGKKISHFCLDHLGTQTFDFHDPGLNFSIAGIQLTLWTHLVTSPVLFVFRVSGLIDCNHCCNLRFW